MSIEGKPFIANIKTNDNGLLSYEYADGSKHTREYDKVELLWEWKSKPFGETLADNVWTPNATHTYYSK